MTTSSRGSCMLKRMKIKILMLLACGVNLMFAEPPAPRSDPHPLQFDAESKQCAAKPGDVDVEFTFICTNVSRTEISITRLHTSCGCTVAQLPTTPYTLPPGSNVAINVSMNIAGKHGLITKSVNVESSAGLKSLLVSANIPTPRITDGK